MGRAGPRSARSTGCRSGTLRAGRPEGARRRHAGAGVAPGEGKTRTCPLWVYVRDDRPAGSSAPAAAWYRYSPDRKGEHPRSHLAGFSGTLQADAYGGWGGVYDSGRVTEAACWAHARRPWWDLYIEHGRNDDGLLRKPSGASRRCTPSRRTSAGSRRTCGGNIARRGPDRCLRSCMTGCTPCWHACRPSLNLLRPLDTAWRAGRRVSYVSFAEGSNIASMAAASHCSWTTNRRYLPHALAGSRQLLQIAPSRMPPPG